MRTRALARWTAGLVSAVLVGGLAGGCWLASNDEPVETRPAQPGASVDPGSRLTATERAASRDCTSMVTWKRTHDGMPPPFVLVKRPGEHHGAKRVPFDAAYRMSTQGLVWQLRACPDRQPGPRPSDHATHELSTDGQRSGETRYPSIGYPSYWDQPRFLVFDPEGSISHKWRLKTAVENYDRRLGNFRMMVGRCAAHPKARCVHVREIDRPHESYWGQWRYASWTIVLNIGTYPNGHPRLHVASHEIGHSFGLNHHRRGPGCLKVGDWDTRFASRREVELVRNNKWY